VRAVPVRTDHFLSTAGDVHRALTTVTGAVRLLAGVVSTLDVNRAALAESAADAGLALGDLADVMVCQGLADRRTVHRLLGVAARMAAGAGRPVTVVDVTAALAEGGIEVPPELLASLEDPRALLAGRGVTGGWARLPEQLTASGREVGRRRRACTALRSALDGAEAALVAEARDRGGSV
jgi:argininosuccinate lyase